MPKKSTLSGKYWVTKRNALNEMRSYDMSLPELRLFTIYLSRINPKDPNSSMVKFSLSDFHAIMQVEDEKRGRAYYKGIAKSLLRKIVTVDLDYGGFKAFTLFKTAVFEFDAEGSLEWYFSFNAHEDAMPLLFEYRGNYFKYRLWNALRLKSKNQIRFYEILKQREHLGFRVVNIPDLKAMLGIDEKDYPQFKYFKRDVLDPCTKAVNELTDITIAYEIHGKRGRKIHELKFTISKNTSYVDPTGLEEMIEPVVEDIIEADDFADDSYPFDYPPVRPQDLNDWVGKYALHELEDFVEQGIINKRDFIIFEICDICDHQFTYQQAAVLWNTAIAKYPPHISRFKNDMERTRFFREKYDHMKMYASKDGIQKSEFGYLKKIIAEVEE